MNAPPDPELADVLRRLRRLDRRLADLDRGSRLQLAHHVDALLERLDHDHHHHHDHDHHDHHHHDQENER